MSGAATLSIWPASSASTTGRQFGRAVTITLAAVAVGCLIYAVETFVIRPPRRFVESPVEVVMRAFGLAHFCIGWLFLFTSPKVHNRRGLVQLALLTLIGAAACAAFALGGAMRNPFLLMLFYGYFIVHEVRDETVLYQRYEEASSANPERGVFLSRLGWAAAALMICVLIGASLLQDSALVRLGRYGVLAVPVALACLAALLVLGVLIAQQALRRGYRAHGDWRGIVQAHRPLLAVYGGLMALLVLGSLLGSVGFHLIILVHVSAWLVFVAHQLGRKPLEPTRNLWHWLRSTPTGFATLHVAVALLILVLMAVRVHVWERAGLVSELLARSSFPYWSLMHITIALWRPR